MKIPIYGGELKILILPDFNKVAKKNNLVLDGGEDAFVFISEKNEIVMCFQKDFINPGLVAHEAIHVASILFRTMKIEMDPFNDEPLAYFIGWVVDEVYKKLDKKSP